MVHANHLFTFIMLFSIYLYTAINVLTVLSYVDSKVNNSKIVI